MDCITMNYLQGRVRAVRHYNKCLVGVLPMEGNLFMPTTEWQKNMVVYEWASIVAKLLAQGDIRYRIGGMYLEFENVASPGTVVVPPTLGRTRNVTYYDGLSGNRDYLRVPMSGVQTLSSDVTKYPHSNQLVFFARSAGVEGVHGLEYSYAANSVVFGASLVAMVDEGDATQDLILSSFYFADANQQPKLTASEVGLEWELTLQ